MSVFNTENHNQEMNEILLSCDKACCLDAARVFFKHLVV